MTGHNDSIQCMMVFKCWIHTHCMCWNAIFKSNNTLLTIHYLVIEIWKKKKKNCVRHEVKPSLLKIGGKRIVKEKWKRQQNSKQNRFDEITSHERISRVTLFWFRYIFFLLFQVENFNIYLRVSFNVLRLNIHMNHWLAHFNAGTTTPNSMKQKQKS